MEPKCTFHQAFLVSFYSVTCTEFKYGKASAFLVLCECIYGHHVCNYSVNPKLDGSFFAFALRLMEPSQPVMAYFAIRNYSLVHTHTDTHTETDTHTDTHTRPFLCPLVSFTAVVVNRELCMASVLQSQSSFPCSCACIVACVYFYFE